MTVDDGLNGNPKNKTPQFLSAPPSKKYQVPQKCPYDNSPLQVQYVYVGVFPYIHTGVNFKCTENDHEFTFCFPYNFTLAMGYTIFDSQSNTRFSTEIVCPFHTKQHLIPVRLYGDLIFTDGTKKLQLRCPVCHFSERVTFQK